MGIVDEDIARVRAAADIVAIVSEHLALKRVGRRWQGLCPFHAEKSPSFYVNAEEGLYHCFGCQASGDVITFVREIDHLDFVGAVERLAGRTGVTLRYTDKDQGESRKRRAALVDAMAKAVDWYHQRLMTAADAGVARGYLRSRGFDKDTVIRYQVGWAPDDWDALVKALRLPADVLVDAGLAFRNSRDRLQDSFRARVLFPIFDAQGDPVAIGGRVLPGGNPPKYKNSSETQIYSKSKVLYGFNWAKTAIVETNEVVVCEGYTDVIGMAQAGVDRAVATCGTALTDDHIRLLTRFARRIVLAFDADAAGQAAAERFYAWEKAHEIDVAVADLPAGVDPADLARTDPERLRKAVEAAIPFLGFRVERVLGAADLSTPEGRARAAETALAVISEHPSEFVRDQYLMEVADRCRVDADRLRHGLAGSGARGKALLVDLGERARPERTTPEIEALRLAIHEPAAVASYLDVTLFADPLHAAAYSALAESETLAEAIAGAHPEVGRLLSRLAVEETDAEALDVVCRLVTEAARRAVNDLGAAARHADDPMPILQEQHWLIARLDALREEETRLAAVDQLVAWMTDRGEERA